MAQTIGDSKLLDAWASDGEIEEPDISKIEQGWLLGEQPPHEFFNWIQNTFGQKINHVLQRGVASWDSGKDYEAGDIVGSGGSVWIAQDANTNSEPGSSNTDWVVVLTAKDFATDAEAQDGTDATLAVTPANLNATVLGMGQTWQDVFSSRSGDVSYTNTTGQPIFVSITFVGGNSESDGENAELIVDGILVADGENDDSSGNDRFTLQAIIPNQSTYRTEPKNDYTIIKWAELR